MRLDHALDEQDENDRKSLYLMGLTNSAQSKAVDKMLDELQQRGSSPERLMSMMEMKSTKIGTPDISMPSTELASPNSLHTAVLNATRSTEGQKDDPLNTSTYTTGKFIKKLRASTKIPIEHKMQETEENGRFSN